MMRPGDVVVERYRLIDLLNDARGARFWLGWDGVLARHIALHVIPEDDPRAGELRAAAKRSAAVHDPRLLRVLDIGTVDGVCYVVSEWGEGTSLNNMVIDEPLAPRRAAWLVGEVAELVASAHAQDIAHSRLVPENVMIDDTGAVKVIGFAVDAALHGLPAGRVQTEVLDLAGVLYTALTGKWAGPSKSSVESAPREHGRVLRPRQVRAGVPRFLDSLCDEVLSPYAGPHDHGYDSAAAIGAALMEFVGDPAAMAEAEAARTRDNTSPRIPRITLPPLVVEPATEPEPQPEPEPEPDPESGSESTTPEGPPPVAEQTVAGTPVFYDEMEDVGWMNKESGPKPPPPPPFEEIEAKPLFAPEPADGAPARQPRPGHAPVGETFWPWENDAKAPPPTFDVEEESDDSVPGRTWMRSAWALGSALVLLVAVIIIVNLSRQGNEPTPPPSPGARESAPATSKPTVLEPKGITDLDPFGNPPEENPEDVGLAIDGDPATAWQTNTYRQQFGPDGLKPGVGLVLDLGEDQSIASLDVRVKGDPTEISVFVVPGNDAPTGVEGLEPVASGTSTDGRIRLTATAGASGRWVVVWITALPKGLKGQIAEIQVRG